MEVQKQGAPRGRVNQQDFRPREPQAGCVHSTARTVYGENTFGIRYDLYSGPTFNTCYLGNRSTSLIAHKALISSSVNWNSNSTTS